ncbi:MAG: LysE family translocator [Rhodospirillaceae bacterium]|nr:LysE family translocator [Rhodospirillaceae bacterium]
MELSGFAIFALALLIAAGSPGPSIAALVARVISRGWRDVAPFLVAMWVGELIWLSLAIAGLSALAETFHWVFVAVKYLGVGYLAWLAWKMWTSPISIQEQGQDQTPSSGSGPFRMFWAGLAVTLGNPKIMVFYLALLPTIIDLAAVTLADFSMLAMVTLVVLAAIDIGYVVLAAKVRVLLLTPTAMRVANRVSAAVMGAAAAAIASR